MQHRLISGKVMNEIALLRCRIQLRWQAVYLIAHETLGLHWQLLKLSGRRAFKRFLIWANGHGLPSKTVRWGFRRFDLEEL